MRKLALAIATCFGVLSIAGASSALQVDLLWYQGGTDCYTNGPNILIDGACGGNQATLNSTNVVLSGYSSTLDSEGAGVLGSNQQLDMFVTNSTDGIMVWNLSVRYDQGGTNVLTAIAAREYNIGTRPTDGSSTRPCQPENSCTRNVVTGTSFVKAAGFTIDDVDDGSGSEVRNFGNSVSPASRSLGTKKATQAVTFRLGSIIFTVENVGTTSVYGALGTGEVFGTRSTATTTGTIASTIPVWNNAIVIPEPSSIALVGLALLGVGMARRRQS